MRTLGASRRQVLTSIIVEALVIGALASVVGLFLGLGLAKGLFSLFDAGRLHVAEQRPHFATRTIVVSILVGVLVALIASLRPAIRATRVPPIAAVREGATLPPSRFARYRTLGSILLTAAGFAALLYGLFGSGLSTTGILRLDGDRRAADLLRRRDVRRAHRAAVRASARLAGDEDRRRRRLARPRQRAPQSAAHRVDRIRADDRARARDARRRARGRDHAQLPRRRRQDLAQRRLRDHGAEQLQPDSDRGRRTPRRRARSSRPSATFAPATRPRSATGSSRPPSTRPRARCSPSTGARARQQTMAQLGDNGAFVDKGYAKSHNLRAGSPLVLTFANGDRKTFVVKGIFDPPSGGSPFGRVTISQQAWDAHNANPRNLYTFVRVRGGAERRRTCSARADAEGLPEREGADAAAVRRQPDQRAQLGPEHPLRAARALRDRQPVRDRQHARADGVRADARDRDAARDRHDAPSGAADDPARERDHRADRRRARHRARDRARRAARRARRLHPVLAAARLADRLRRR